MVRSTTWRISNGNPYNYNMEFRFFSGELNAIPMAGPATSPVLRAVSLGSAPTSAWANSRVRSTAAPPRI